MKKLLLAAALLFTPSLALAQTYWTPQWNYVYRDGGNDLLPQFPIVAGSHGVVTIGTASPLAVTSSFAANWGTVIASDTQGSDSDFTVNFYTPASGQGSIVAQTALFVVNFGQSWSAASQNVADGGAVPMFAAACQYAGPSGGTPGVSAVYALPTGSGATLTLYNMLAFTPAASTNYHYSCHVYNTGAAF